MARVFDRRYQLIAVAVGGVATSLASENTSSVRRLGALADADAVVLKRTMATAFTEMLGEATVLVVALVFVAFLTYALPRIFDYFFALCRVPRHVRYQLTLLARAIIVVLGVYYAFVLVGVDLSTVVVVGSVTAFIASDWIRPLVTGLVAGFWIQSSSRYELGHRIRVADYYGTIVALGAFAVSLRLMPSSVRRAIADDDGTQRRQAADEYDAGVDDYGVPYADRIVDVPNGLLLTEVVVHYLSSPIESWRATARSRVKTPSSEFRLPMASAAMRSRVSFK